MPIEWIIAVTMIMIWYYLMLLTRLFIGSIERAQLSDLYWCGLFSTALSVCGSGCLVHTRIIVIRSLFRYHCCLPVSMLVECTVCNNINTVSCLCCYFIGLLLQLRVACHLLACLPRAKFVYVDLLLVWNKQCLLLVCLFVYDCFISENIVKG